VVLVYLLQYYSMNMLEQMVSNPPAAVGHKTPPNIDVNDGRRTKRTIYIG